MGKSPPVFKNNQERNSWLRKNNMTLDNFYYTFYPKKDLYTNQPLKFKNENQYINNDFNLRDNLVKYLNKIDDQSKNKYIYNFFKNRRNNNKINFGLSQCELRSFMAPSATLIEYKFKIDLNKIYNDLDITPRFIYDINTRFVHKNNLSIIRDTREQNPFNFPTANIIEAKLDYGDYALEEGSDIFVERKNLSDFVSTIGKNYLRFEREVKRAFDNKNYIVVLIEENFDNALSFNTKRHMRYTKANPSFIFHNMRKIMQEYYNIQFLFVNGRKEAAAICEVMLSTPSDIIQTSDLQFYYDLKLLCGK